MDRAPSRISKSATNLADSADRSDRAERGHDTDRVYVAIDLKSFYASVECVERDLDALSTNLVVADESRTTKTICLAVSPSLKAYGISGRARLFEVVQKVKEVNAFRQSRAAGHRFTGKSADAKELAQNSNLELAYIVAPPRMAYYMEYSRRIYSVYLKYVAPEDIHVYSIDEVFIDVTGYLKRTKYGAASPAQASAQSAREFAMMLIHDVLKTTKITATAGIGPNLFLAKVAMDIVAKHIQPDANGVRIAELDEMSYRWQLWKHRPLTDFWRVGAGYAAKLEHIGLYTMGDIARCSLDETGEKLLSKLFGVNAELLIDHAWGWEPCTIDEIKAYQPTTSSLSTGQVLPEPYDFTKARLIVREMADQLALDLVDKGLQTNQIVLYIGYDRESLSDPEVAKTYSGPVSLDSHGRMVPKSVHGSLNLERMCSSARLILKAATELFDTLVDETLLVRRVSIGASTTEESEAQEGTTGINESTQLDLFTDYRDQQKQRRAEDELLAKEKRGQKALLAVRKRFGKNAVLKGMNLEKGARTKERNNQIGGHKA